MRIFYTNVAETIETHNMWPKNDLPKIVPYVR